MAHNVAEIDIEGKIHHCLQILLFTTALTGNISGTFVMMVAIS